MTQRPSQPVQAPSGLGYGQRKALEDAQKQVPLPNRQPARAAAGPQAAPIQRPNIFGATERPSEPITAGAGPSQMGLLLDDPTELLRAIILQGFDRNGSLRRLLERMSRG